MNGLATDGIEALVAECRVAADAYHAACVERGRREARQAMRPGVQDARDKRFNAGMIEAEAFGALLKTTGRLIGLGHGQLAADIRQRAIVTATEAGLRAIKDTLRAGAKT